MEDGLACKILLPSGILDLSSSSGFELLQVETSGFLFVSECAHA